jgi:hypothetical protein
LWGNVVHELIELLGNGVGKGTKLAGSHVLSEVLVAGRHSDESSSVLRWDGSEFWCGSNWLYHGVTSSFVAHGVGFSWSNQSSGNGGWDSEKLDSVFVDGLHLVLKKSK